MADGDSEATTGRPVTAKRDPADAQPDARP